MGNEINFILKPLNVKNCRSCKEEDCFYCYSRTEAINKIARKRFEAEYGKKWEETTDEFRGAFLKTAETMLDALLDE